MWVLHYHVGAPRIVLPELHTGRCFEEHYLPLIIGISLMATVSVIRIICPYGLLRLMMVQFFVCIRVSFISRLKVTSTLIILSTFLLLLGVIHC